MKLTTKETMTNNIEFTNIKDLLAEPIYIPAPQPIVIPAPNIITIQSQPIDPPTFSRHDLPDGTFFIGYNLSYFTSFNYILIMITLSCSETDSNLLSIDINRSSAYEKLWN